MNKKDNAHSATTDGLTISPSLDFVSEAAHVQAENSIVDRRLPTGSACSPRGRLIAPHQFVRRDTARQEYLAHSSDTCADPITRSRNAPQ